jgi:hypothetical protein
MRETATGLQLDFLHPQFAVAHLRAGQIRHDRHAQAHGFGGRANVLDVPLVLREFTVRKVQPRNIHSSPDHLLKDSDSGDDFGFVGWELHFTCYPLRSNCSSPKPAVSCPISNRGRPDDPTI